MKMFRVLITLWRVLCSANFLLPRKALQRSATVVVVSSSQNGNPGHAKHFYFEMYLGYIVSSNDTIAFMIAIWGW